MKNYWIIILLALSGSACDFSKAPSLSRYINQVKSRPMLLPPPLLPSQDVSPFSYSQEVISKSPFLIRFNNKKSSKTALNPLPIVGLIKDEKKIWALVKKDAFNLEPLLIIKTKK